MTKPRVLAVLAAVGVLLVFTAGRTTGAFWTEAQPLGASNASTGDLVLLNGDRGSEVSDYAFTALGGTNLRPGAFAQAPLTMKNGGSADLRYRLSEWTSTSTALADHLLVTFTTVEDPASCGSAGGGQPGTTIDPSDMRTLTSAESEVLCVRVTLAPNAPQDVVSAASGAITFTWFGEQDI